MPVILRAMVMLLILVGLPAAWVYYGPLPPSAQRVADRVVELAQEALGWESQPESVETITAPRYLADNAAEPFLELSALEPSAEVAAETLKSNGNPRLSEQVEPLLVRLRGLGVSQYSLEKWGDSGQMYRFCCAMPLAQSDEVTRQFEAVTYNPKTSIEQVVVEVSHWQTARQGHQLLR